MSLYYKATVISPCMQKNIEMATKMGVAVEKAREMANNTISKLNRWKK